MSRRNRREKHHHFITVDRSYRDTKLKLFILILDIVLCFFISMALYAFAFDGPIWSIKEELFANTEDIVFVSSSTMLNVLQFWISVCLIASFLWALSFYLLDKTKFRSSATKDTDLKGAKKFFIYFSAISLFFILISFFSYCRVGSNGVDIRSFSTFFSEKHYYWSQVNSVEIRSYKTRSRYGSSRTNYSYEINFGSFDVDLTSNSRYLQNNQTIYRVHQIVKKEGIPIYKNIEYEYEGINNFLQDIGE